MSCLENGERKTLSAQAVSGLFVGHGDGRHLCSHFLMFIEGQKTASESICVSVLVCGGVCVGWGAGGYDRERERETGSTILEILVHRNFNKKNFSSLANWLQPVTKKNKTSMSDRKS